MYRNIRKKQKETKKKREKSTFYRNDKRNDIEIYEQNVRHGF